MDKNYLVTKSNALITASYDLSLQEQRLILFLANMVKPNDENFKEYGFRIKDFMDVFGVETQTKYSEIPKISKGLMKKVFEIKEGNDIVQLSWLSSCRYKTGEGFVILKFDPALKPYMLQIKKLYTSYKFENILSLKSKFSLRLFELLKCNEFKKTWTVELDELKKIMGVNEKSYSIYQNVKNRIILKAQMELKEKTDISFEFEEIKTGKKVTSIKFYITNISNKKSNNLIDNKTNEEIEKIVLMMKDHNITTAEASKIYKSSNGDIDHISKIYDYFKNKDINNFVALMIKMVKPGEFNDPKKSFSKTSFNNFISKEVDYDELEKKLLFWNYEE